MSVTLSKITSATKRSSGPRVCFAYIPALRYFSDHCTTVFTVRPSHGENFLYLRRDLTPCLNR